jgi:hypothetical protein
MNGFSKNRREAPNSQTSRENGAFEELDLQNDSTNKF